MGRRIVAVSLSLGVAVVAGSAGGQAAQVWNGRIAFAASTGIGSINGDGSGVAAVDLRPGDVGPAWSPDGRRIAFAIHFNGAGLVTVDPDGSSEVRLTDDPSDAGPAWSPDGTTLAFTRQADVWLMNADGTSQRRLTDAARSGVGASEPAWSPDGARIVFGGWHDAGVKDPWGYERYTYDLFVVDVATRAQTQLTEGISYDWMPAWSPDGSKIAFASDRDGSQRIYTMNPDGSSMAAVTDGAYDTSPAWSPDGTRLAFARENGIWVVARDGSHTQQVGWSDTLPSPAWQPLGPKPQPTCDRWGTTANDVLAASDAGDTLCGSAGDDTLIGGAGNDRLVGGPGDDRLAGAQGFDVLLGGTGDDVLDARDGHADELDGGAGANVAYVDGRRDRAKHAAAHTSRNLAAWRPASASNSAPNSPPTLAVDGRNDTLWNSGGWPSQWIEIDLQRPTRIGKVQLVGTERPEGAQFLVLGKGPATGGAYRLLHRFTGPTADEQALLYSPRKPWRKIRYLRVVTPQVNAAVGWVAWREISVYAPRKR